MSADRAPPPSSPPPAALTRRAALGRLAAVAAPALLGFPALTGCRGDRAPGGRIRITYWEKWGGFEGAAMRRVVDDFNASQDRILVDYLSISQVDRKTLVATAGGDPPDLAGLWPPQVAAFSDNDALQPLDPFVEEDGGSATTFLARYLPPYASLCRYDGRFVALPTAPSATALHWNKTLFREAGLDPERPPQTVAELDDMAGALTRRDARGTITQMGFLPQEPGWWPWAFARWFGGHYIDDHDEICLGRDPGNLAAMEWIRGYTERFGVDNIRTFTSGFGSFASPQSAFFSGKVAMVFQGVWLANFIKQYAPGLDYGVAPWPQAGPPGPPYTIAEADMLVIPRGSRHPREAWEFLRYVASHHPAATRPEELSGIERLCWGQEKNSPLRHWSPCFADQHPHPHIATFRDLANSARADHVPLMGVWLEYNREITTLFEKVRLLAVTPAEGLAYAQSRMEASWRLHRQRLIRLRGRAPEVGRPPAA